MCWWGLFKLRWGKVQVKTTLNCEEFGPRISPSGVRLFADTLLIRGSPKNDLVVVRTSTDLVRVEIGKRWWQFELEQVRDVIFTGAGGRDRVMFDLAWEGPDNGVEAIEPKSLL